MVTDEDRDFARDLASRIYQNHVRNGRGGCDANHIAADIPYEETLRRGLLAECAWVHEFGGKVNDQVLDYGDGGTDFPLWLRTKDGGVSRFIGNVKSKTVRASWGALMDSGTHLRVEVSKCAPTTIYIFGIYLEPTDDAEVLAWELGSAMIDRNERAVWPNGNGEPCYIKPFEELRNLQKLRDRLVTGDHPCCICGNPIAPFGYRPPAILSGEEWRCRGHRV